MCKKWAESLYLNEINCSLLKDKYSNLEAVFKEKDELY